MAQQAIDRIHRRATFSIHSNGSVLASRNVDTSWASKNLCWYVLPANHCFGKLQTPIDFVDRRNTIAELEIGTLKLIIAVDTRCVNIMERDEKLQCQHAVTA